MNTFILHRQILYDLPLYFVISLLNLVIINF